MAAKAPATNRSGLTLGPLLYHWPADEWADFYARIADEAPVDCVYMGEVVCSKRLPVYADRIPEAVDRLRRGGKEVVLSSQILVTLQRERRLCRDLAEEDIVEVNDISMLAHLEPGRRFDVGPFVNVYNEHTLAFLAARGARRVCLPPELPQSSVCRIAAGARGTGAEVEILAFGRVPLAISARCYHARIHGLSKDSCQYVCGNDPDGLEVDTLDGERFLAVNGVQTLSHSCRQMFDSLEDLRSKGVGSFRLSPQHCDMVAVCELFRCVLDGQMTPGAASRELAQLMPGTVFSDWFDGGTDRTISAA